ncbi:MAG: SGNH/GDSL hydrolase family protein [Leptospiraceae bacterium]|nr:SGNH/GDSL hydrolase family protein [Leptospiraceae bacterium]
MDKKKYLCLLFFLFNINCYSSKKPLENKVLNALVLSGTKSPIKLNLIGDSLSTRSESFGLKHSLPSYQIQDFSIPGYSTNDWLLELDRTLNPNPDIFLIVLGTNDAYKNSGNDFLKNLIRISELLRLKSAARIIYAIPPITKDPIIIPIRTKNNQELRERFPNLVIDLERNLQSFSGDSLYPADDPIHPNDFGKTLISEIFRKYFLNL